jgi:hydroxypyruvate isomerase
MERRDFLRTTLLPTGLAAAGLASSARAQTAAPPKAKITSSVMLWTLQGSLRERMEIAAKAGLQSVELVAEHVKLSEMEFEDVKKTARSLGLGIDTIIATPEWKQRQISMVDPGRRDAFLADVKQSIGYAKRLEVPYIILMSGDRIPNRSYDEQWNALVEATLRAGELAEEAGVTMIVEPLNDKVNHQGFFLTTCVEGIRLVRRVKSPHVKLLFDIYHEQVQIGNVIRTAVEAAPYVAVYHVADNPGRNDPGTGELNWNNIYKAIQQTGYSGYITMEYLPKGDQLQSLTKAVDQMRKAIES